MDTLMQRILLRRRALTLLAVTSSAVSVWGCGTTLPPKELLDARAEFQRASTGPAMQIVPADVHVASEALDAANKSFTDNKDAPETLAKAYVAMRKAQIAEVIAATKQNDQARADALHDA